MDGMSQFPGQTPEPRPAQPPLNTSPPLLPEPSKQVCWPWVLLGVVVVMAFTLAILVYYGAPVPEGTSDL